MTHFSRLLLCFILVSFNSFSQKEHKASFQVVPLGIKGGIDEKNLSAYLLAPSNSKDFICLDAGTINAGIEKAIDNKVFKVSTSEVLKKYIKGYLISHAHLDHVSGLIINSPADSSKTVYATEKCMEMMENHYFNDQTWANFGDKGPGFPLKKYHFQTLNLSEETPLSNTTMSVKAFPLSHVNPFESTAFLIKNDNDYALYLGDTGPDSVEKSDKLKTLWTAVAPLVQSRQLKGIFIEVSFPNEQPDKFLFGHLTPNHLMTELHVLEELAGKGSLNNFKIIITHLKPPAKSIAKIKEQLKNQNNLGLKIIYPEQGKKIEL
ncbi:MBL fold metallo-hydrolase [Flavobacterium johnsoniae]|uniref:Cyclic-AMP phosphodiesterase n=1 Tax=Flavobacterium johnsoniae (strain ATCC 17061 / DSM 2064 / JCM 8514 / BCRC 14874 / CCUG 350202 / NBRC 14942 / NCIMB 11054 / UW101) TaxID=376686 RepID=A5FKL1_FLAJ1|nr:3',5'-cyclic-nucleotide phosphodiesterase [Flavobacterium johnsoniae]ABQ04256.1 cyclic-AMP phosphodiesterase [Flavobacterium johnsoniae UW101]OXG02516.1 3',5'-cyclic-nucleotide phosphodiesterase [Flavobacterium johnsoniae UW101]WQG83951.1 3',5'-cyclic-nucleotide phosphodiesterase [Flavobacterium johnsoniae UW101]SHK17045.1 3',5'-cyclic-nucleotide phosphodiesterase [Flavobacterium johnsoniae]